jgi:hypothetical protein
LQQPQDTAAVDNRTFPDSWAQVQAVQARVQVGTLGGPP